jgi:hypothetical protein
MRFRGAAFVLATACAAALIAPDASAQAPKRKSVAKEAAKSEWRFTRSANAPTLFYGAGTEDFQISFSCQPDTGLVRIIAQIGSRGVQPGDGAAIRLANGKKKFEVAGTAFSTAARTDIDIGSATRLDPELFVLFKAGETLTVEVPGRKRSLPVQNAGPSTDAFQKACTATVAGARPATG